MAQGTRCYSIISGRSYVFDRVLADGKIALVLETESGEAYRISLDDLSEER